MQIPMLSFDFLVIGGGIAGCSLALELDMLGQKVLLTDFRREITSSAIAAGLINPIVPRGVKLTWKAEEWFLKIPAFYDRHEKVLGEIFYQSMPMFHLYPNAAEAAFWENRLGTPFMQGWAEHVTEAETPGGIKAPFGYANIYHAGKVRVHAYCEAVHAYFLRKNSFMQELVQWQDLEMAENQVGWRNYHFKKVIWANGYQAMEVPIWEGLPFRPNRGHILSLRMEEKLPLGIYKRKHWLVPGESDGIWLAGSNFRNQHWRQEHAEDVEEIMNGLRSLYVKPLEILAAPSAVRPAVADRRPFLGSLSGMPLQVIFNGLGSKGSSLVAALAPMLANWLLEKGEIDPEVWVGRSE